MLSRSQMVTFLDSESLIGEIRFVYEGCTKSILRYDICK